jgi:hypothetical protein
MFYTRVYTFWALDECVPLIDIERREKGTLREGLAKRSRLSFQPPHAENGRRTPEAQEVQKVTIPRSR